jgi:ribulose-phosphate 3-epimerase
MLTIIPSILTNNFNDFKEKLSFCEGVVDRVQIDVVDGVFADNRTIDPSLIGNLDIEINLDFHLMVKEPTSWVEKCANAGADRIIAQIEMMDSQIDFVGKVQSLGLGVGLAINLKTPVSKLNPVILTNLDMVLVMTVEAGFGGQKFHPEVLEKVSQLDEIRARDNTPYKICVDGGETKEVIDDTRMAGADEVIFGGRLFEGSLLDNIEKLTKAAYGR